MAKATEDAEADGGAAAVPAYGEDEEGQGEEQAEAPPAPVQQPAPPVVSTSTPATPEEIKENMQPGRALLGCVFNCGMAPAASSFLSEAERRNPMKRNLRLRLGKHCSACVAVCI
ncbi:unnamed protein product [Amoebophrya sp. A25]|nr:unnamed protein product [Amoebophrya sp. A25]|eukprot:GSA25T00017295001.1